MLRVDLALNPVITMLFALLLTIVSLGGSADTHQALPALHDGIVVSGPGQFDQNEKLEIRGKTTLRNLTLHLNAPVILAEGATLILEDVKLIVSDPPGALYGASGLRCEGPATIVVRRSSMVPVKSAHPLWQIRGRIEVEDFQTENSEFHLDHVQAVLSRLRIFELEISKESLVSADHLSLVFLSTHSGDHDRLEFENIPVERPFDRHLDLGSGAKADLKDTRIQMFLLYVQGATQARLANMDRVQLAIFPDCQGALQLAAGRMGERGKEKLFPEEGATNCPFRITLQDVNVDTWDVYASGKADLKLHGSKIDELNANENARLLIEDSEVYADWMAVWGQAEINVNRSAVGSLSLAATRPDLATSQVRMGGKSRTIFNRVRFDCGIVATEDAYVEINDAVTSPRYVKKSGNAAISQKKEK
jgi:hypothetical protein